MHPTMRRLYDATAVEGFELAQAEVARRLNTSSQRIKNWEIRGISQQGANEAQTVFGVSSTGLLNVGGAQFVTHPQSQPARLTGPMIAGAHRMARMAVEASGQTGFDPEREPEDAELLAEALLDVLEHGLESVSDGDVLRFVVKVGGQGNASGSSREDGAVGGGKGAAQRRSTAGAARRRRAGG